MFLLDNIKSAVSLDDSSLSLHLIILDLSVPILVGGPTVVHFRSSSGDSDFFSLVICVLLLALNMVINLVQITYLRFI